MLTTSSSAKTLRDVALRPIPVIEPSTSVQEATEIMQAEPLKAVALVGDEQFMGVFDAAALESDLLPAGQDLSTLSIGPYVHPTKVIGTLDTPLLATVETMRRRGLDLVPVIEGAIFQGVLTRQDAEAAL